MLPNGLGYESLYGIAIFLFTNNFANNNQKRKSYPTLHYTGALKPYYEFRYVIHLGSLLVALDPL